MKKKIFLTLTILPLLLTLLLANITSCTSEDIYQQKVKLVNNDCEEPGNALEGFLLLSNETDLRAVIEAPELYKDKDSFIFAEIREDNLEIDAKKMNYSSNNYKVEGRLIEFHSIYDMHKLLSNQGFKEDYKLNSINIINYYLSANKDIKDYTASLLNADKNYYLRIIGIDEEENIASGNFMVSKVRDVVKIAKVYSKMVNAKLYYVDGLKKIYFFTTDKENSLFTAMSYKLNSNNVTIYFWEQEGILGVIIVPGKHKKENFDFCEFVKYDF